MQIDIAKVRDTLPYQSGLLALAAGIAAALLMSVNKITLPIITEKVNQDQQVMIAEVLTGAEYSNDIVGSKRTYQFDGKDYSLFYAKDAEGKVSYLVAQSAEEGYSGKIQLLVGTDRQGVIQGVRVLSHSETPGLGDKIELAKSDWVLSFNQRSLEDPVKWGVKKDGGTFDQFSGATITPRAVVKGVHHALLALDAELKTLKEQQTEQ